MANTSKRVSNKVITYELYGHGYSPEDNEPEFKIVDNKKSVTVIDNNNEVEMIIENEDIDWFIATLTEIRKQNK